MEDWQNRVITEHNELKTKWLALYAFFHSKQYKVLNSVEQALLQKQWMLMRDYVEVLDQRIQRFEKPINGDLRQ